MRKGEIFMEATGVNNAFIPAGATALKEGYLSNPIINPDRSEPVDSIVIGRNSGVVKAEAFDCDVPKAEAHSPASLQEQGATASKLAKIGAGVMIGVTIAAAVASGAPPLQSAASMPDQETPVTMVISDEALTQAQNYAHNGDNPVTTRQREFPRELRLDAEGPKSLSALSEFEAGQVLRIHTNLEYHEDLRIDVFRPTYMQDVEAPPEVKPETNQSAENVGGSPGTGAQTGEATGNSLNSGLQRAEATSPKSREKRQRQLTPFGVDLGNGLFYDLNGNITFNPLRLVGEFNRATIDPAGLFNSTTVESSGDHITIDRPGLWDSIDIVKSPGKIVIDRPGLWNDKVTIYQQEGRTVVDPPGFNTWLGRTEITEQGSQITYDPPGIINSTTVTKDGTDTRIGIPGWANDVIITEEGNTIRIKYPGWANDTIITREKDSTRIDPAGWGNSISIQRSGNRITVDPAGLNNSVTITIR